VADQGLFFSDWRFSLPMTSSTICPASYGQFCPGREGIGDFSLPRWTSALIVRELMMGAHSFNDIHRGVPLISRAVPGRTAA